MADIRTGGEQRALSRNAADRKEASSQPASCHPCCSADRQTAEPVCHNQLLAHRVSVTGSERRLSKAARELVCAMATSAQKAEGALPADLCLGLRNCGRAGGRPLGCPYSARTGEGVQKIASPMDRGDCRRAGAAQYGKASSDLQYDGPEAVYVERHGRASRAVMEDPPRAAGTCYRKTKRFQQESWSSCPRPCGLSSSTSFCDRLDG